MPDPIWLDTNALIAALNGDAAVNQQLANFRMQGRQLLVPPKVGDEVLNGNVLTLKPHESIVDRMPSADSRSAIRTGMQKLGVTVDMSSQQVPMPERVDNYGIASKNVVSESDRLVLGQIKASAKARGIAKPQMITGEKLTKPMVTEAHHWGIESIPTAKNGPGAPPAPPRINLADEYPVEKEGPISRFFKDRPVLKKLGLIGVNVGAQMLSQQMLKAVQEHFESVIAKARAELDAKCPDPARLRANAGLDQYKRAYDIALSRLRAPSGMKLAQALAIGFTRDQRDIPAVKKYFDDRISNVQSAADGTLKGYAAVADEYINAMISLYTKTTFSIDLQAVAADVEKRGEVIRSAGDKLNDTFWRVIPLVVPFPAIYYQWMDVHTVAGVFQDLGTSVTAFSSEIRARDAAYENLRKQLDAELTRISDELARYDPTGK